MHGRYVLLYPVAESLRYTIFCQLAHSVAAARVYTTYKY